MSRHRPHEVSPPHRYDLITVDNVGYPTAMCLRYSQTWLFKSADQVFDAIWALREGVSRPHSRFRIDGIGPVRFNAIVNWLER
jgi:hypothetical protein